MCEKNLYVFQCVLWIRACYQPCECMTTKCKSSATKATVRSEEGGGVEITGNGVMNENKKYLEEVKERQMKRQNEKTAATPASDAATPALMIR